MPDQSTPAESHDELTPEERAVFDRLAGDPRWQRIWQRLLTVTPERVIDPACGSGSFLLGNPPFSIEPDSANEQRDDNDA